MGLSLGTAVILGAVLARTDPVLASDLQVGPPGEPQAKQPQFALTSEAGVNDGFAFPFVFLGVFIASEGGVDWSIPRRSSCSGAWPYWSARRSWYTA
jgi:NhaP-type Na+/H+ or K+/H+ antiporter